MIWLLSLVVIAPTAALGLGQSNDLVQSSTAVFVAPLVEETTKGLGLLLLWTISAFWVRELDGALYGGVVGPRLHADGGRFRRRP